MRAHPIYDHDLDSDLKFFLSRANIEKILSSAFPDPRDNFTFYGRMSSGTPSQETIYGFIPLRLSLADPTLYIPM